MNTSSYRPGFFYSLIQSCHSSTFYARIKDIRLLRAVAFLAFFSILVAIFALITLSIFWTRIFPNTDAFLQEYDRAVPEFEAVYDDATLLTTPEQLQVFVGFDDGGQLILHEEVASESLFRLQVNTEKELKDLGDSFPQALGVYLYKDGFHVSGGFQSSSFPYDDFGDSHSFNFTKDSLRLFVKGAFPIAQEWLRRFLFVTGPMILFLYHFIGGWVLAFIFSILGVLVMLILQKPVDYPFLIKLAFYALVPAFVIALVTALLSISVSFIPLLVFTGYYFYGLSAYKPR